MIPVAGLLAAPVGAGVARAWDPLGLERELTGLLEPGPRGWFLTVWGLHAGVYAGALLGTIAAVVRVRRRRRGLVAASS